MIVGWIRSVSPFRLAAAVALGADRWPAGRRWLLLGAIALGLVGVFALGSDIWWTLWELSPSVVPEGAQALLMARNVAAAIVFVAAHALLAVGLWAARPARHAGAWRQTLMRLIGVAGTVALVADLWAVSRWLPTDLPAIT